MSPQETQVLESFLNQLVQAKAGAKDPQAEAMIAEAIAKQPDAAYLLVQRALLLDQALATAKAQIAQLQSQAQGSSSNFLDPANAWGNSASAASARPYAPAAVPAAPYAQQPAATVQPSRPGFLGSGFGSTLGTIAATAAGVAGGAFLFQGIENLLHHNNGNGFLGQAQDAIPKEETIINNYYNDAPARDDSFDSLLSDNFADVSANDDDSSLI